MEFHVNNATFKPMSLTDLWFSSRGIPQEQYVDITS